MSFKNALVKSLLHLSRANELISARHVIFHACRWAVVVIIIMFESDHFIMRRFITLLWSFVKCHEVRGACTSCFILWSIAGKECQETGEVFKPRGGPLKKAVPGQEEEEMFASDESVMQDDLSDLYPGKWSAGACIIKKNHVNSLGSCGGKSCQQFWWAGGISKTRMSS